MLYHLKNSFSVFVFFFLSLFFPAISLFFVRKYLANNSFLFLFNLFYIVLSSLASSLDRLDECRLSPLSSLQQASFNSPGATDLRMHIATSTSISLPMILIISGNAASFSMNSLTTPSYLTLPTVHISKTLLSTRCGYNTQKNPPVYSQSVGNCD